MWSKPRTPPKTEERRRGGEKSCPRCGLEIPFPYCTLNPLFDSPVIRRTVNNRYDAHHLKLNLKNDSIIRYPHRATTFELIAQRLSVDFWIRLELCSNRIAYCDAPETIELRNVVRGDQWVQRDGIRYFHSLSLSLIQRTLPLRRSSAIALNMRSSSSSSASLRSSAAFVASGTWSRFARCRSCCRVLLETLIFILSFVVAILYQKCITYPTPLSTTCCRGLCSCLSLPTGLYKQEGLLCHIFGGNDRLRLRGGLAPQASSNCGDIFFVFTIPEDRIHQRSNRDPGDACREAARKDRGKR